MRKYLLILSLLLPFFHLHSQERQLLKTFKYRINDYREININLNGGGQLSNVQFVTGQNKVRNTGGIAGASFYKLKSTDNALLNITADGQINYNSGKTSNPSSNTTARTFYAMSHLGVTNKCFRNKFFLEVGANIYAGWNKNKFIATDPAGSEKNYMDYYSTAINIGIGKGRLENVTDMQNALWLYKSLQEEKLLSRSLTVEELTELGHTITIAKNTRVLDIRKRTQYTLETTDKFFQQKGVLTTADIRYFISLNDILFFAFNNPRLSGTEIFARLSPAIDNASRTENHFAPESKYHNKIDNKSALLTIGITKHVPLSLQHQNNYGVSLRANYIAYHQTDGFFAPGTPPLETKDASNIKEAGINVFFQHVIYPNTRTTITIDLQSEGGYRDDEFQSAFFGTVNVNGTLNYFISYRTRFVADIGLRWQDGMYNYDNYDHRLQLMPDAFQLFANAGLQVSL